ncbi:MAG: type II toxin-antitoxin system ParD family antitoxin [Gammaproteobacteria bacterium]|nr:type II toxin-antitoxin system ParD family antitoxin [Gammaproteobacteria bacterium]
MQRKTITITTEQESWIKSQINSGQYGNDSEYIRDLIRSDKSYKDKVALLQSALIKGESSGVSQVSMADVLVDAKKRHNV